MSVAARTPDGRVVIGRSIELAVVPSSLWNVAAFHVPAACMKFPVGAPDASATNGLSVTAPAASDCQPHSTESR